MFRTMPILWKVPSNYLTWKIEPKLEHPDYLPQRMSICPVPKDGFKKPKILKVLTHEFEVESVLLKVS